VDHTYTTNFGTNGTFNTITANSIDTPNELGGDSIDLNQSEQARNGG
jgi:hypothetical protein